MPRSDRTLQIFALALLVATSAIVVRDVRRDDPVARVADEVRAMLQPGDLVLLSPADTRFDLEAFEGLPAAATQRSPIELERFDRVFLVHHAGDSDRPPVPRYALLRAGRLIWEHADGPWTVELFQMDPASHTVDDLVSRLPSASVSIVWDDGRVEPCPWDGHRHQCAFAEWVYVGPISESFAGQPHRCIWTHPVDGGTVVVEFPRVTGATHIDGWYALTDYAVSIPNGGRATITLRAGSDDRRFHAQRRPGRVPLTWALPADHDGPLRMEFTADRAGVRHLCWDVQATRRDGATP